MLHPVMAQILEQAAQEGAAPFPQVGVAAARAAAFARSRIWNQTPLDVAAVRMLRVPGPAGDIPVRLYTPHGAGENTPVLLYAHGGGWVICDLDTHDNPCRKLAQVSGFAVASMAYRLAPEHPFPAGLEDCVAVARWFAQNGGTLGLDSDKIVIGGDSAGGNLAVATLLRLKAAGQSLCRAGLSIYGAFDPVMDNASTRAFGGGEYLLSKADMDWFWDLYLPDPASRADPFAVPLLGDLSGLPPLYLTAAAYDLLRDDSHALSQRLTQAGQPHIFDLWPGVCHVSAHMFSILPPVEAAYQRIGAWLKRVVS